MTIIQQDYYPLPLARRTDPSPYAQGFQDWLAFGDAANALDCAEYAKGKAGAKRKFFSGRPWERDQ